MTPSSNPFSTRHTRPGAIPFLFATGESGPRLVEQLQINRWWGQIVGPHGSGKSTMLHALAPLLEAAGRETRRFTLRQGERSLSSRVPDGKQNVALAERPDLAEHFDFDEHLDFDQHLDVEAWHAATQVIVDGYEQLRWWNRIRLQGWCYRRGAGLLVTTHRPVGIPLLTVVQPTRVVTRRLVRRLWPEHDRLIADREIDACFDAHQGNVRETLFALYDVYESRT